MRCFRGLLFLIGIFVIFFAPPSGAHNLELTGVKILIEKTEITVSVVAHLHILKTDDPATEIADRLKLRIDGEPFSPGKPQLIRDKANGIVIWQARQPYKSSGKTQTGLVPENATQIAVDAPIFPEIASQSTVVTVFQNRQMLDEAVLDSNTPSAVIGQGEPPRDTREVIARFGREGVVHIFGGVDHVLFLLCLLLLGGSWKQLLKIVTAFTLAHSITLSLAATGVFALAPRLVEPVIALSIVIVALANLKKQRAHQQLKSLDARPWLAFGFGLIHGFGFAGALSEIGLPHEALGWALLAFNGGVELGQAILVLIFAPTLAFLAKKWPKIQVPLVHYGSASVALVGLFWFVQRVLTV